MSITTNAGIANGYFGYWRKQKNGNEVFVKLGRAVYLDAIEESIETDDVYHQLRFLSIWLKTCNKALGMLPGSLHSLANIAPQIA